MSLAHDPYTMKVCIDGGKPVPCDFDMRGLSAPYAEWQVRYAPVATPPVGQRVKVEIRITPGAAVVGEGVIRDAHHGYGDGWDATIHGYGPLTVPVRSTEA